MTKTPQEKPAKVAPKKPKKASSSKSAHKKPAPKPDIKTELPTSGQTELGRELAPLNALKRYIVHYSHLMHEDVHHFAQEGISDGTAFHGVGFALKDSFENSIINQNISKFDPDPLTQNIANIISTVAASFLMYSLWRQREEKKSGWTNALKMWAEYENDKKNEEFGQTYEERKKSALKRLAEKIEHSGLQFTQLPTGQAFVSEFNKEKGTYRHIIKRKKLNLELEKQKLGAFKSTQEFLKRPLQEKVAISGYSAWEFFVKTMATMKSVNSFIWDSGKEISNNLWEANVSIPEIINGYKSGLDLGKRERELKTQAQELAEKIVKGQNVSEKELQLFSRRTLTDTSGNISEEDTKKVLEIMRDIEVYKKEASRTRFSLYVQSVFISAQAVQCAVNSFSEGKGYAALFNGLSVLAAMGPLRGFAKELTRKLGKIETSRAEKAQDLARIYGISLSDEEITTAPPEPA